uniref:TROVE domain-containing protein n=1 Tax=viral metagenome TaxID=1070528 RepID=A0A6C0GZT3_9ZZZZ
MSSVKIDSFFRDVDAIASGPFVADTTTENGAGAFSSTGSTCLDFFSSVVRDTPSDKVVELFKLAYLENPHLALKILFNLRDCIGNGKQEKRVSFDAFNFLKTWKPRTYLKNIAGFASIGCFKDLLVLASMSQHPMMADPELCYMAALIESDVGKHAVDPKAPLSLVAKWAPTEGCQFDKKIRAAHKIAAFLNYSMSKYRKTISALRKSLDVLERHETLGTWDEIDFSHVPSVAMKKQKKAFERHLPEKFSSYLAAVMAGKAKMNSKGVQPHELVRTYINGYGPVDPTVDAQWLSLISRLSSAGLFKDAIAVCDVSGSMGGVPMEVSIALGLVVSELTVEPFNGKVITFSAVPQWHRIEGATLRDKIVSLSGASWGMNTDFIAVFKMLLAEAQTYRLASEQMIKKIFVFTDMQFDTATNGHAYQTSYQTVKAMYDAAGYTMPQIVFWNLRDTNSSFPVRKDTPGVALMSGFSAEMLKLFLDDEEITPYKMMLKAVMPYATYVVDEPDYVSPKVAYSSMVFTGGPLARSVSVVDKPVSHGTVWALSRSPSKSYSQAVSRFAKPPNCGAGCESDEE